MQVVGGAYSTIHNAYLFMFTNRQFGPLMVLRGKAPTFRMSGPQVGTVGASQLRYWSFCTGEGLSTTETPDGGCGPDYQVPLDGAGYYTVVISRAADRPSNAQRRCGAAWINQGDNGDGTRDEKGALLHPDSGFVLMRNLLHDAAFSPAIQNVTTAGSAAATMGEYYPVPRYMTTQEFEARGCPVN